MTVANYKDTLLISGNQRFPLWRSSRSLVDDELSNLADYNCSTANTSAGILIVSAHIYTVVFAIHPTAFPGATIVYDPQAIGAVAATDTKICCYNGAPGIYIKNRLGATYTFYIQALGLFVPA